MEDVEIVYEPHDINCEGQWLRVENQFRECG